MSLYGYDPKTRTFNCTECGACCRPDMEAGPPHGNSYVGLIESDEARLRKHGHGGRIVNHFLRTVRTKANGGQCVFLKGVVGEACRCAVYPIRPRVCREFTPGGPECLDSRRQAFGDDCEPVSDDIFRALTRELTKGR